MTNAAVVAVDLNDHVKQQQQQLRKKRTQGICILFLSAFLFSLMGLFLQFTGRMGLPSTEMVFLRAVFQGIFTVTAMFFFRVDSPSTISSNSASDCMTTGKADLESRRDSSLDSEGVDMVIIDEGLLKEEKKIEDDGRVKMPHKHEGVSLLEDTKGVTYNTQPVTISTENKLPATNIIGPRIIHVPFGTTPTMRNIVILRGLIGGFGFVCFYHALSTLRLGDATTLLSLYPIITIFLARIVLGEEMKPLHLLAATFSILGATLISQPSFLFGDESGGSDEHRPPALGYIAAFVGSFCASAVIVLIRRAGRAGAHTLQLLCSWAVFGIFFSLLVGAIAASNSENQRWRVPSRQEMPYVLGVCITGSVAHLGLNYAAKLIPATLAGLIRSSDIVHGYVLGNVVLGQHPEKSTYMGVMLVCSGLIFVLLNERTESKKMKRLESIGTLTAAK